MEQEVKECVHRYLLPGVYILGEEAFRVLSEVVPAVDKDGELVPLMLPTEYHYYSDN